MEVTAALVKEQGVTFAVMVVKKSALHSTERDTVIASAKRLWPGVPVVLMAQDHSGRPEYYGRRDIVRFLANISFTRLPWRKWRAN